MGTVLSKNQQYKNIIKKQTIRQILFPKVDNKGKQPTVIWPSYLTLPSLYPFKSSQQVDENILTIYPVTYSAQTQSMYNVLSSSQNRYPYSCIGLILCEYHQVNKTYYVFGTGTLIHNKIVLTSAQNVYCRRLNTEYVNIKFITGVKSNKCTGIYDVMRIYYQKEKNLQDEYEKYDLAVLQLYDDLSENCGYVGWKSNFTIQNKQHITYGYMRDILKGSFNLIQVIKFQKLEQDEIVGIGSGRLIKEKNQYYIIGLYTSSTRGYKELRKQARKKVAQWTTITKLQFTNLQSIKIENKDLREICSQIAKNTTCDLRQIILWDNKIDVEGCKYLSQADWPYLTSIDLQHDNIGAQGCKFLCQANWIHLTYINLWENNIRSQGCRYLSQANWPHLTDIDLSWNYIDAQGCKYLSQTNWRKLTNIDLYYNYIDKQGCKYLSQSCWLLLTNIDLKYNNINNLIDEILLMESLSQFQI